METLVHADIFFFITSIFVIFLIIGFAFAIFYIVLILKDIRYLSGVAKKETDKLTNDIDNLRNSIKEKNMKAKYIFNSFLALFGRRQRTGRKKTSRNN